MSEVRALFRPGHQKPLPEPGTIPQDLTLAERVFLEIEREQSQRPSYTSDYDSLPYTFPTK